MSDSTKDHKPLTEAELKEMEAYCHGAEARGDYVGYAPGLIAEVRRLREGNQKLTMALTSYAMQSNWSDFTSLPSKKTVPQVWDHPGPGYREAPGYQLARDALGWGPPPEPCDNPSCDGVKDDKTFGDAHRCFKDGRWLDDGSEM